MREGQSVRQTDRQGGNEIARERHIQEERTKLLKVEERTRIELY